MATDTKEKILKAAAELFAKSSYEGVGIRDIAKKAQVNSSLISYYFGGKENLYKEVLSQHFDELVAFVNSMDSSDELRFIRDFMRLHIDVVRKRGKFSAVIAFRELSGGGKFGKAFMEAFLNKIAEKLINVIKSAQKKGIIRDLPAEVVLHYLIYIDAMFAIRFPQIAGDEACDMAFDLFMRGVG